MCVPLLGHRAVFWSAFFTGCAALALLAVLDLRPAETFAVARQPIGGGQPRLGRMIVDHRGETCQQISFNNDTGYITATHTVRCPPWRDRAQKDVYEQGGMFGSLRSAFRGPDLAE